MLSARAKGIPINAYRPVASRPEGDSRSPAANFPEPHRFAACFLTALRGVHEGENFQRIRVWNRRFPGFKELDDLAHQSFVIGMRLRGTHLHSVLAKYHRAVGPVRP